MSERTLRAGPVRANGTGPGQTPFLQMDSVALRYGGAEGTLALEDTTLSVARGEFAAVVGPSGCGKSSLMKLVTGLIPPDSGEIVIFGDKVRGPVKIAGMAFQNPNLLPWRKVIDNVLLPLETVEPHRHKFRNRRWRRLWFRFRYGPGSERAFGERFTFLY